MDCALVVKDSTHTWQILCARLDLNRLVLIMSGKCYEYICTHVDDFIICLRDAKKVVDEICSVYQVKDSPKGPPSYYLGNDYKRDKKG